MAILVLAADNIMVARPILREGVAVVDGTNGSADSRVACAEWRAQLSRLDGTIIHADVEEAGEDFNAVGSEVFVLDVFVFGDFDFEGCLFGSLLDDA